MKRRHRNDPEVSSVAGADWAKRKPPQNLLVKATAAEDAVAAKTGTLDETSGLAGTVTSQNGNVYAFAFLSNGSNVLEARRALDELASVLRDF